MPFLRDYVFPEGTTNFLFFLTKKMPNTLYVPLEERTDPRWNLNSYMFKMNEARSQYQPDDPLTLHAGIYSWIPVTTNDTALINWCSNLVHSSQISPNLQAFYELLRDGYRLNPETSRIHQESMNAFDFAVDFMSTNFIRQVLISDTNLTGWARANVNNAHWMLTRTFIGRDGETVIP